MTYGLGIDAGGTYTDTAIVELESGRLVCGNKALTTHDDLTVGIRESLSGLDPELLPQISLTSLSSTLATNSVVENKGCRVGLICIGINYVNAVRPDCYAQIEGRFSMSGKEEIPLDARTARAELEAMKGKVDAIAISGYVSVRNPSHERRVEKLARSILKVPVVCAHDLTSKLGFEQRTTTAIMNARLIPVIEELLSSVRAILKEFGVKSPLMMVKGDGALMKDSTAMKKPVETILSGPASSLMGAKSLTGEDDAVVIDIGGTTSDIGLLKNGLPRIEPEGANIGGRRTRVMAADIATYGIGGDSRIVVNGKDIILSTVRAIPLCIAAVRWPSVKRTVASLDGLTDDRSPENCRLEDVVQDTEFFTLAHVTDTRILSAADRKLLTLLRKRPFRLTDAGEKLGIPAGAFSAGELESRGYVMRIGVTPTDILHAEGSYTQYDAGTSRTAVEYLARKCGTDTDTFIRRAKELIAKRIAGCAMEKVLLDESGRDSLSDTEKELRERVLNGVSEDYSISFNLRHPIIGIGAPVGAWLPAVADMLHTRLILPENSHIGNAIGAVTGSVCETVVITVRASGPEYVEEPECDVFTGEEIRTFDWSKEAMSFAKNEGTRLARERALAAGAKNPVVEVFTEENILEVGDKKYFRGATVTVKATGKPDLS